MSTNTNEAFCILAAGSGMRLGKLTASINKALLPIDGRAIISHIIEKIPPEFDIVIALGYEKNKVKEYCLAAYPMRKFVFVDVDNFDGPGSGPGYSLLQCRKYLERPFYFSTIDCLVSEPLPGLTHNWLGVSSVEDSSTFSVVKIEKDGRISDLINKKRNSYQHAFIGLCGIISYASFWSALESCRVNKSTKEYEMVDALKAVLDKDFFAEPFSWFDTGTLENYSKTKAVLEGNRGEFNFSKVDEYLYEESSVYIKYFEDTNKATKRVKRAEILFPLCPKLVFSGNNIFSYKKVKGDTLYSCLSLSLFKSFLKWCDKFLWSTRPDFPLSDFNDCCYRFYYSKTRDRYSSLLAKLGIEDDTEIDVNGVRCKPVKDYLDKIDWKWLSEGSPSFFHGDLQFDNILVRCWDPACIDRDSFVLIDWREDFGGSLEYGDLYYDLAKLYGGILMPYNNIRKNKFSFEHVGISIAYDYKTSYTMSLVERSFCDYIALKNYDMNKINIIMALIYLNMSPLHNSPWDELLYYHSRFMLESIYGLCR